MKCAKLFKQQRDEIRANSEINWICDICNGMTMEQKISVILRQVSKLYIVEKMSNKIELIETKVNSIEDSMNAITDKNQEFEERINKAERNDKT